MDGGAQQGPRGCLQAPSADPSPVLGPAPSVACSLGTTGLMLAQIQLPGLPQAPLG